MISNCEIGHVLTILFGTIATDAEFLQTFSHAAICMDKTLYSVS